MWWSVMVPKRNEQRPWQHSLVFMKKTVPDDIGRAGCTSCVQDTMSRYSAPCVGTKQAGLAGPCGGTLSWYKASGVGSMSRHIAPCVGTMSVCLGLHKWMLWHYEGTAAGVP